MEHNKIFKIAKKCIINLVIFLLMCIAIFAIWGLIQINVQNKEYINIFGYSVLSTETGSMAPTIQKGDIIIIKIGDEIKENDIITYKKDNVLITHRISKINENTIIAKGDYNNTDDVPIQKEQVIGKVVFIVNNVEIWKKVFTDAHVIIPVIITVILFVALISYKEKKGEEND